MRINIAGAASGLTLGLILGACSTGLSDDSMSACEAAAPIGRFDPAKDLFLAQFDIKTDTDDLHSAAAVATMLAHPKFACVDYLAVSGTYGTQGGAYVDPGTLFSDAFGQNWVDAHGDRDGAVERLAMRAGDVLAAGGHVWIMEGGQSDVSAATVQAVLSADPEAPTKTNFHIVQHSGWNEKVTSPEALDFVRRETDYVNIPDGNATGNGSPGFNTPDGTAWDALIAADVVGPIWALAREMGTAFNGSGFDDETISAGGYDNKSIGAGGLDFSDTSEAAWIFGYDHLEDVDAFVAAFVD